MTMRYYLIQSNFANMQLTTLDSFVIYSIINVIIIMDLVICGSFLLSNLLNYVVHASLISSFHWFHVDSHRIVSAAFTIEYSKLWLHVQILFYISLENPYLEDFPHNTTIVKDVQPMDFVLECLGYSHLVVVSLSSSQEWATGTIERRPFHLKLLCSLEFIELFS